MADGFIDHCLELLSPLGAVRAKRMFGGHGIYVDDIFVAIVAFERLYLKVDDTTRPQFEAAGCEAFTYATRQGSHAALSYYTAPEEALESPALMLPWARLALQAALTAAAKTGAKAASKRTPKPARKGAATRRAKRPA